ncbi:MAG TPA: class I SAM-dependent methyltransferase [Vicinamibacterales bacterium]|nr:class I SAM-dependent methyltransferase [Vicinamibacterales bacterium]
MTIRVLALVGLMAVASVPTRAYAQATAQEAPTRRPDVIYVPTPEEVVDAMLQVANVTKSDVVYDLGCGDGRIPVAAAKKYGARGVCIDIDPQRIKEANENVQKNNVGDKVKVLNADLFTTDISEATVVTLYLLPSLNVKLMPKLMKELKPGTRVVSHAFDMGDCKPEKEMDVNGRKVYFWTIPFKGCSVGDR